MLNYLILNNLAKFLDSAETQLMSKFLDFSDAIYRYKKRQKLAGIFISISTFNDCIIS